MIRRAVLALDRTVAVLLGLVLVAGGLLAAAWTSGRPAALTSGLATELSTSRITGVVGAGWFPATALAVGVVLVLLALWWASAHLPRRDVGLLGLTGTRRAGRLLIDPAAATRTAAEVLEETRGIRSASGRVLRDRGRIVLELRAVVDADADLPVVAAACDAVADDLHGLVGRDEVGTRVRLTVSRRRDTATRVL